VSRASLREVPRVSLGDKVLHFDVRAWSMILCSSVGEDGAAVLIRISQFIRWHVSFPQMVSISMGSLKQTT